MNALVSAGGGTRAGAYARLWQGAGACRLGRVGGGRFVGVICHECAGAFMNTQNMSFPVCVIP
jgi:hypothetical protein